MRTVWSLVVLAACSGGQISSGPGDDTAAGAGATTDGTDGPGDTDGTDGTDRSVDCQSDWDPDFFGSLDPSLVTGTPYTRDAGLGAVLDEARRLDEGDAREVRLAVSGAVVTNVVPSDEAGHTFTVGDGAGHLLVYGVELPFSPEPGQILDFEARRVTNHFGTLEITEVGGATAGSGQSLVYVESASGAALDYRSQGAQNVRIHGVVLRDDGPCGGDASCYTLLHGDAETTVRTRDALPVGDCALVTAPVSQFDGTPQLDLDDPAWVQTAPSVP